MKRQVIFSLTNTSTLIKSQTLELFDNGDFIGKYRVGDKIGLKLNDNSHRFVFRLPVLDLGTKATNYVTSEEIVIPRSIDPTSKENIEYSYIIDIRKKSAGNIFASSVKGNFKNLFSVGTNQRKISQQMATDTFELTIEQPEENKIIVNNTLGRISVTKNINEAVMSIYRQLEDNIYGNIDFHDYDYLDQNAKNSPLMNTMSSILLIKVYRLLLGSYFDDMITTSDMLYILNRLSHIRECRPYLQDSLRHYKYLVNQKGDINSAFSTNVLEEMSELKTAHFSMPSFDFNKLERLVDNINQIGNSFTEDSYSPRTSVFKQLFDLITCTDKGEDYYNIIKKALVYTALTETENSESKNSYPILKDIATIIFHNLYSDGNKIDKAYNVDCIIAESIHLSYVNLIDNINVDLNNMLKYVFPHGNIEKEQYDILQIVFSYLKAYKQEEMVLEAMVNNGIETSIDQNQRISFLKSQNTGWRNSTATVTGEFSLETNKSETTRDQLIYDYRFMTWGPNEIKAFFDNLSMENKTYQMPAVVSEWTKYIEVNKFSWDEEAIKGRVDKILKKNFGERFSVSIVDGGVSAEGWQEVTPTVFIEDTSNKGYPWIAYNIVGDQMMLNQISLSIYTLYIPEKDTLKGNIYENNNNVNNKIQMLKMKQNPRLNNMIQMITNSIVNELEAWINSGESFGEIY